MINWTLRVEDGKELLHLDGVDYVLIPSTFEKYMAGYPDTVSNEVIESENNKIRVRLGHQRSVLQDNGEIEVLTGAEPVNVWCVPLGEEVPAPNINQDNDDGFVTG